MSQAIDKFVHATKRRNLAHVFSAKEITAMEPRVIRCVQKLCSAIRVKASGDSLGAGDSHEVVDNVFDIRPWLNMLAYDAITAMFFTKGYDSQRATIFSIRAMISASRLMIMVESRSCTPWTLSTRQAVSTPLSPSSPAPCTR